MAAPRQQLRLVGGGNFAAVVLSCRRLRRRPLRRHAGFSGCDVRRPARALWAAVMRRRSNESPTCELSSGVRAVAATEHRCRRRRDHRRRRGMRPDACASSASGSRLRRRACRRWSPSACSIGAGEGNINRRQQGAAGVQSVFIRQHGERRSSSPSWLDPAWALDGALARRPRRRRRGCHGWLRK